MKNNTILDQKGYALIVVLLIITVVAIISPTIISKIMSSTLQYKHSEKKIQSEHLEQMGIKYMKIAIDHAKPNDEGDINVFKKNLFDNLADYGFELENSELVLKRDLS